MTDMHGATKFPLPVDDPDGADRGQVILTTSEKRARTFSLSLRTWNHFVYPEMYLGDNAPRAMRILAATAVLVLMPLMLIYFSIQRAHYRRQFAEFGDPDAPFRHSIGANAFVATAVERFVRRRRPKHSESDFLPEIERHTRDLGSGRRLAYVADGFFADPDFVREVGLRSELGYYEKGWYTSAISLDLPYEIKEMARQRIEEVTGLTLPHASFHSDCDGLMAGWNGAFNAKLSENLLAINACNIHNHADIGPRGWAAVVYLTPREVPGLTDEAGTSLWIDTAASSCSVPDKRFDGRLWRYTPLTEFAPRYNRIVVFPSEALHRGEAGFGFDAETSRFFMTFFFESSE